MRRLVASEWMTLDGVFYANTMDNLWSPYDSPERQGAMHEAISACDVMLFGRQTYEILAPNWSAQTTDELGLGAKLNSTRKYAASSSMKKADWNNAIIITEDSGEAVASFSLYPTPHSFNPTKPFAPGDNQRRSL
jgi:hypothetical protein